MAAIFLSYRGFVKAGWYERNGRRVLVLQDVGDSLPNQEPLSLVGGEQLPPSDKPAITDEVLAQVEHLVIYVGRDFPGGARDLASKIPSDRITLAVCGCEPGRSLAQRFTDVRKIKTACCATGMEGLLERFLDTGIVG